MNEITHTVSVSFALANTTAHHPHLSPGWVVLEQSEDVLVLCACVHTKKEQSTPNCRSSTVSSGTTFFSSSSSLSNATNTKTRKGVAHTMSIGEKKKKLLFQTNFHCTNSDLESIAFPFLILSSLLGLFFP